MAEGIAHVIRAHGPTSGMSVASGVTCRCGYWTGGETPGVTRPAGFAGLAWHQGQEAEAMVNARVRELAARLMDGDMWDALEVISRLASGDLALFGGEHG
ncbi:hypothetical protein VG1_CDS0072 [Arthrobacter phage Cupello]|nr:hypothetical protein VG1_CDS0072 [Arthrobacter phage Cupello]